MAAREVELVKAEEPMGEDNGVLRRCYKRGRLVGEC